MAGPDPLYTTRLNLPLTPAMLQKLTLVAEMEDTYPTRVARQLIHQGLDDALRRARESEYRRMTREELRERAREKARAWRTEQAGDS